MANHFKSITHGVLDYLEVINQIATYIRSDPDSTYKIIVGSDSEAKTGDVDFVTAIIAHRLGKGGVYFWQKRKIGNQYNMQQRIAHETQLSLELAWKIRDSFQHNGLSGYEPEVHIDIGLEGVSRDMVKWVTGMVLGSGFAYKIKPESFAASTVADRYT